MRSLSYIRYIITETTVLVNPTSASNGISFILSFISIDTAPPVAWKNEPCGNESITVEPACIIAAKLIAGMPALIRVSANVCDAIVAPDVVDASCRCHKYT